MENGLILLFLLKRIILNISTVEVSFMQEVILI